jgi:hypothetical protein
MEIDSNILTETIVNKYNDLTKIVSNDEKNKKYPRGGFLPIMLCKSNKEKNNLKIRESIPLPQLNKVSISSILKNRRNKI